MTNLDWHVRTLAQHRDEIDPRWNLPFCDLATFDKVSSKHAFAEVCEGVGVRTPRSLSVVFAGQTADAVVASGDVVAAIAERGLEYPLIGKPSASADWFEVAFPGKSKIHHFESEAELTEVLAHLEAAQYPSEFLVQEFVPGDETHMRSLTAYRDRAGQVTLMAGGQVLLEEHTPGTMGIPAAILTGVDEDAFAAATRFLHAADYYGFANFDYKVHSGTGENVFFEMNPRIGRNNHYVTSSGVNVVDAVARDLLPEHFAAANPAGDASLPAMPGGEVLYSVVPWWLLRRYLLDPDLRAKVDAARKRHGVFHPLRYRKDASLKRRLYVAALDARLAMKYRQYYPHPTETGF
ncbi:carboxylate--amine ligase [Demequina litorisediminis]|uniref:Carboxylate--amine ligase n=1 Tax=Demequina litorisediminis TaxID=1849022 RepID=A0ABQ6IF89_9MICO|nr:carboxylate--amine ligase [Demequina litorisediminis]GMA35788.1 carboxylate--amine ligase [Demequina litorisediminis]